MIEPQATNGTPEWVASQKEFSGPTAAAVHADFMDWYRANVHDVRSVKPKGVKRVSGNEAGKFMMLMVEYEIKSESETGHSPP
jgi:hypothetical protein